MFCVYESLQMQPQNIYEVLNKPSVKYGKKLIFNRRLFFFTCSFGSLVNCNRNAISNKYISLDLSEKYSKQSFLTPQLSDYFPTFSFSLLVFIRTPGQAAGRWSAPYISNYVCMSPLSIMSYHTPPCSIQRAVSFFLFIYLLMLLSVFPLIFLRDIRIRILY